MSIAEENAPVSMDDIRKAWLNGPSDEAPTESVEVSQIEEAAPEMAAEPEMNETPIELAPEPTQVDIETVWVKGANGQKQKVEISYSDKAKIKDAYLKMAGMRKFQLERDEAKKTAAELEKKHQELSANWSNLESIYKERGAKGLFEQLAGGQGAWEAAVEAELANREKMASLSPEERLQHSMLEKERTYQAEKNSIETKYNQMLAQIEAEKQAAATRSMEAPLYSAFDKYRLAGKLGDPVAEQRFDKAIWSEVVSNLEAYDTITPSVIEKEFKSVSSAYSKFVNKQVDSKLKAAVETKKVNAAAKAQVQVKKAQVANTMDQEVQKALETNNWSALLQKAFGKR